jgi:glyceraldehyde 3-phosphate dehydrogenase
MVKVAINGFGRIGRLAARSIAARGGIELAQINDPGADAATAAHLFEFDSVHGRWKGEVSVLSDGAISIDGAEVVYSGEEAPGEVDWQGAGVDLVLECSGKFRKPELIEPFFEAGVERVIVSAPVHDEAALNVVVGVNDELFDPASHRIVTAASCTTNCLAPIVKVIHGGLGIRHGSITTMHDLTNTQVIVDAPHRDLRRARAAGLSLIPTTTGSATAIGLIFPDLKGKLDGLAVRVPLLNASLTDCVFEVDRDTERDEINGMLEGAASGDLDGILGFETRPLVSVDFRGDSRSGVVDGPSTMVTGGTQVKILAWYDNEWGYANRMVDLVEIVAGKAG